MNRLITSRSLFGTPGFVVLPILVSICLAMGALMAPPVEPDSPLILETIASQQELETAQEEEPEFEGWEVPSAALFITGRQDGYIEPCGCTGLANQLGGMMRRYTLLNQLKESGWNVVGVDAGNQVRRFGRQANLKMQTSLQCLGEDLGYSVVGLGIDDLKLPTIELIQAMTNSGMSNENFVIANVTVFDESITSRYRVLEQGGKKIGMTVLMGDEHLPDLVGVPDVTTVSTDAALQSVIPGLHQASCDFHVLLVHASLESCQQIANKYPYFDLLVCCGVDGDPTREPQMIESQGHTTQLIQTGNKGMYVGVVGLFGGNGATTMKYQRVPLNARFEDSPAIKEKFYAYQKQMEALGLDGLEIKPVPHPTGRKFVGSDACYDCHDSAFDVWKDGIDGEGGPHFRATRDLTDPGERTWVQRHYDPECLSCHVTGWNAQQFFPYESGYLKLDDDLLHGNGCENCHGPGSMHVAAENGDIDVTEEQRVQYFKEMIVTLEEARTQLCVSCHDLDNSPDFHVEGAFEEYWEQIKHYEDE